MIQNKSDIWCQLMRKGSHIYIATAARSKDFPRVEPLALRLLWIRFSRKKTLTARNTTNTTSGNKIRRQSCGVAHHVAFGVHGSENDAFARGQEGSNRYRYRHRRTRNAQTD